jgi:hypothetical protein
MAWIFQEQRRSSTFIEFVLSDCNDMSKSETEGVCWFCNGAFSKLPTTTIGAHAGGMENFCKGLYCRCGKPDGPEAVGTGPAEDVSADVSPKCSWCNTEFSPVRTASLMREDTYAIKTQRVFIRFAQGIRVVIIPA